MANRANAGCRRLPRFVFLLVMLACCGLVGDAEAGGGAGLQTSDTFGVGERISTFPADFSGFSCNLHSPASMVFQGGVLTATIGATGRIHCSDYAYTCDTSLCEIVDQVVTQGVVRRESPDGGTNQPPRATGSVPAQTLTVGGAAASVNVARYFTDPDGDRLTYTARSSRTGVVTASVSGSTVTLSPVSAGTATVTVTARDPDGASATQSIAVTVEDESGATALWSSTLTAASFETTSGTRFMGYMRTEGEGGVRQRGELSDRDFGFRGTAHHVPFLAQNRNTGYIVLRVGPPLDERDVDSMTLTVDGHALAGSDASVFPDSVFGGMREVYPNVVDRGVRQVAYPSV